MSNATATPKLDPVAMQQEFSKVNAEIDALLDKRTPPAPSRAAIPWAWLAAGAGIGAAVVAIALGLLG